MALRKQEREFSDDGVAMFIFTFPIAFRVSFRTLSSLGPLEGEPGVTSTISFLAPPLRVKKNWGPAETTSAPREEDSRRVERFPCILASHGQGLEKRSITS